MIALKSTCVRFVLFLIVMLCLMLFSASVEAKNTIPPNQADETTITEAGLWQQKVTYGRTIGFTTRVFREPNDSAQFSPQFETYKGALLALKELTDYPGWYWVIPNNGIYNPWWHWDGVQDVYMKGEELQIVDDFEPVSVYANSQGVDRQVIAIRKDNPELLLVEQGNIILRVPIGMGWDQKIPRDVHKPEDSPTPLGEFAIAKVSVSRHMSVYPGVPFVMYYSGGMALHEAYWIAWNDTYRGNFWTGGCLNVPDLSRWNIDWEGKPYSIEHFVFKWGMNNFRLAGYDPYVSELFSMKYDDEAYRSRNGTLRVLIVSSLEDLYKYRTPAEYTSVKGVLSDWGGIISQYNDLVKNKLWRLPHSENGNSSYINVTFKEMAQREPW